MGVVFADMSVSVDGYATGPNDSRENPFGDGAQDLHAWLRPTASHEDRALLEETVDRVGAIVMGRRSFEKNEGDGGWGDAGPMGDIPCFVVTHHVPDRRYPSAFTFVLDGVVSAIQQAQQVAGDKDVHLFGATVMQQALPLSLVDEIHLHVMPILVGGGTSLFGALDSAVALERLDAVVTAAATHLKFRVLGTDAL
jgi:dihydrofolate reductase